MCVFVPSQHLLALQQASAGVSNSFKSSSQGCFPPPAWHIQLTPRVQSAAPCAQQAPRWLTSIPCSFSLCSAPARPPPAAFPPCLQGANPPRHSLSPSQLKEGVPGFGTWFLDPALRRRLRALCSSEQLASWVGEVKEKKKKRKPTTRQPPRSYQRGFYAETGFSAVLPVLLCSR